MSFIGIKSVAEWVLANTLNKSTSSIFARFGGKSE